MKIVIYRLLCGCLAFVALTVPALAGDISKTPEPSTLLLLGGGLAAVLGVRHYRKRKQ